MMTILKNPEAAVLSYRVVLGWDFEREKEPAPWSVIVDAVRSLSERTEGLYYDYGMGFWRGNKESSVSINFTAISRPRAEATITSWLEEWGNTLNVEWVHVERNYAVISHRRLVAANSTPALVEATAGQAPKWDRTRDSMWRDQFEQIPVDPEPSPQRSPTEYDFAIDNGAADRVLGSFTAIKAIKRHLDAHGYVRATITKRGLSSASVGGNSTTSG